MTTIKTECPSCGVIEVLPDDIRLVTYHKRDDGIYRCRCTICGGVFERYANHKIVAVLTNIGCEVESRPGFDTINDMARTVIAIREASSDDIWAELLGR